MSDSSRRRFEVPIAIVYCIDDESCCVEKDQILFGTGTLDYASSSACSYRNKLSGVSHQQLLLPFDITT